MTAFDAAAVQAAFGGAILKTRAAFGGAPAWHDRNRIAGQPQAFTAAQFAAPVARDDLPASPEDALADTSPEQVAALARAFRAGP